MYTCSEQPCKTIEQALMDAFDRFTAAEILQREEVCTLRDSVWQSVLTSF